MSETRDYPLSVIELTEDEIKALKIKLIEDGKTQKEWIEESIRRYIKRGR